jgi:suppressor of G2 allele of SKP1
MDQAVRGAAALAASNYDEAIKEYSAAIVASPTAVDYYVKRSTAYQRSKQYAEALSDAEVAVALAHKRAKRELIKDAQLRRAIALFFNERYADAEFVLGIVKRLDDKEKTIAIWDMKIQGKLKALPEDDELRKVTAKEVPDVDISNAKAASAKTDVKEEAAQETVAPKPVVPTPANKIKHDWYQNNENVYFTLLAKGVPKDKATVEIEMDSLTISFPIQDSSDFNYSLDPLYGPVDAANSTFRITATKIEVVLKKSLPGLKWKTLEGDLDTRTPSEDKDKVAIPSHILSNTNDAPPPYPTSSRKGAKDWDKVAKDLSTKPTADGKGGVENDLDDEGDETNVFFKHLYKGASPEQQRAMMKSYQESGGTVLSTDWNDIGSRDVVPEPPEGMVAKKYST